METRTYVPSLAFVSLVKEREGDIIFLEGKSGYRQGLKKKSRRGSPSSSFWLTPGISEEISE